MSLSKEEKPPISRDQIDILDFPTSFGELSPIEGFTGPKTPSRRQVLRFFLYLVADDHSLKDASDKVVSGILEKHPTSTTTISARRLSEDVVSLYKKTRSQKPRFVRSFIRLSIPPLEGPRASQAGFRASQAGFRASQSGLRAIHLEDMLFLEAENVW